MQPEYRQPEASPRRTGVRQGDIILSLGGEKLDEQTPLIRALSHHQAGQQTTLEIWRDGGSQTMDVTLDEVPR